MAPDINAAEYLLAGKSPDRVAIRLLDADFTYGDLRFASSEFASCLLQAGGAKGDRVILLSGNSFHWAAAYLGILRAGMVCVPLPGNISAPELSYILQNCEARFAFLQTHLKAKHGGTLAAASVTTYSESEPWHIGYFQRGPAIVERKTQSSTSEESLGDLAALMFTSGSTGQPRGVMVSHANIVANTASIITTLRLSEDDRVMTILPFHYCFGASLLHSYLRVGATLVIDTRFSYPEAVLGHMQNSECTTFAGVPSHYQILLRNSSFIRKSFPSLRSLLQAGGHLPPSFLRQLQEVLPQARIFVMYGQTEATARLACLPPELLAARPGSIGKAIFGVTLRVLNEFGEETVPGEVGEIVAEGENIARGYWRAPEETAHTFRNGALHTGDLATVDKDGFLYVVDRAKEFVKCGGTRVSCRQLEDRLLECEDLLEAAVVGTPDDILGEAIRAFVVPRLGHEGGLEDRLRLFCKANIRHPLCPRDIVVLDTLPKNSSGKVLRSQLRSALSIAPGSACE